MRVSQAGEYLNVSGETVRAYCNRGLLDYDTSPGGQRVFRREQLDAFLQKNSDQECAPIPVGYIRSSSGQDASIATQEAIIHETYPDCPIYKDKSSGLKEDRKGLAKALQALKGGDANLLVVVHRDRLTRFGTHYLELLVESYGGSVQYLEESPDKTLQEELMQDFMALIASFSGKFYRLRGYEQQRKLLKDAKKRLVK